MPKDRSELLDLTLKAPAFSKALKARVLLNLLYSNWGKFVPGEKISEKLWGRARVAHDGEQVRERIADLRKRLGEIQEVTDSSHYFEVETKPGHGYRLTLPERRSSTGSTTFWRPHTKADDVLLVYPEPMFFFDAEAGRFLRYLDTNPRDRGSAISVLKAKHGEDLGKIYGSSQLEHLELKLTPRTLYLGIGELGAIDLLAEWFLTRSHLMVIKKPASRVLGIQEEFPILLGSPRTNPFIEAVLSSDEAQHFAYRPHDKLGFVSVRNADKEKELVALSKRFQIRDDNLGNTIVGNGPSASVTRERLAVLHRLPTPQGRGTITMISCDTSQAIRQVAFALTDDSQAQELMKQAGWNEHSLPRSFEMLFGIKIAPASIEHEAGLAELLAFRSY